MTTYDPPPDHQSPYWSKTTKVIVVVFIILAILWLVGRFRTIIGMLVMAIVLSYLMEPIIGFIERRTKVRRGLIIILAYATLALGLISGFSALGFATFQQFGNLIASLPSLIENAGDAINAFVTRPEPINIGPFTISPAIIPWDRLADQLIGMLEPLLSQSTTFVSRFATSTVRTLINFVTVFIISVYLSTDLPNFNGYIRSLAKQPGYSEDASRLMPELSRVWRSYLRGQIILGLIIFVMVWIGLAMLGVQNSLALGLLGGLLEFIPTIGPVVSAVVAVLVAFFQPENYLGLVAWQYALAVLALMILIQQLENNLLVPRIVGNALDLHPILVIVSVFMGASLGGVLGAILAAPIAASLKVLGQYTWRKLFDLPPFPRDEEVPLPEEGESLPESEPAPASEVRVD